MPAIEVNGGNVVYEILGDEGELLVLTPGGRFAKTVRGLRPLAQALADGGHRVLLWDRPNCGESDVQFYGVTESHMRAETLHGLLRALGEGPCVIAGGSGGARDSLLTVMLYPEVASKVVVWNIVGGVFGMFSLGGYYVLPNLHAVMNLGMEGVAKLPEWQERIEQNPKNRDRLLGQDPLEFRKLMLRWLNAYVPKPGQTIPGVDDELFENITVPTLIVRGGENDMHHPKRTSLEVSTLVKGSQLVEPPWPEDAWESNSKARARGEDKHPFDPWVQLAPLVLRFTGS